MGSFFVKVARNGALRRVSTETVDNYVYNLHNVQHSTGLEVQWLILIQSLFFINFLLYQLLMIVT